MLKRTDLRLHNIKELKIKLKKLKEVISFLNKEKQKNANNKIKWIEKELKKLERI